VDQPREQSAPSFKLLLCASLLLVALCFKVISGPPPSDDLFQLKHDEIALPNGQVGLALSYHTDSNHNYVVEFRDVLDESTCNQWRPWANAPHNYGIVFVTNSPAQRFFRLRRIDQPRSPLFALLANDTGTSAYDGLTSDPTITGMALQFPANTLLRASLDQSDGPFFPITNLFFPTYFQIDSSKLAEISGGTVPDGPHTLYLQAADAAQAILASNSVHFTLDTTPPPLTLGLASAFDSGTLGDGITAFNPITLMGKTEPGLSVELLGSGIVALADMNGDFTFSNITLAVGDNQFYARTRDGACNETVMGAKVTWSGQQCAFSDELPGWTVAVTPPSNLVTNSAVLGPAAHQPVPGIVIANNCAAVMTEGDSFLVSFENNMNPASKRWHPAAFANVQLLATIF